MEACKSLLEPLVPEMSILAPDYLSPVTGTSFHNAIKLDSMDSFIDNNGSVLELMCCGVRHLLAVQAGCKTHLNYI